MDKTIANYFKKLTLPQPDSHKGDNGKLLIIGGSELFHAASSWSLEVASKFVDMVFYASVPSNNELILEAKREFWDGIVVPRGEMEEYIAESDCILIGPGMMRQAKTTKITNKLLKRYPQKRWVIDAGALQMANPKLFKENCIITPHQKELKRLEQQISKEELLDQGVTILLKGSTDTIYDKNLPNNQLTITGGSPGMTKGGTGDVLAGLVAGFYATQEKLVAAVVASYSNKKAGEELHKTVGPYFNASNLAAKVPEVVWQLVQTT